MASGVRVYLDEQIVLLRSDPHSAVQVSRLEQRVKSEILTAVRVVAEEDSISELYALGWTNVRVGEVVVFAVVYEVGVFVARSQIRDSVACEILATLEQFLYEVIYSAVVVNDGNRVGQQNARHPAVDHVGVQRVGLIFNLRSRRNLVLDLLAHNYVGLRAALLVDHDFLLLELLVAGEPVDNLLILLSPH